MERGELKNFESVVLKIALRENVFEGLKQRESTSPPILLSVGNL